MEEMSVDEAVAVLERATGEKATVEAPEVEAVDPEKLSGKEG